MSSAKSFVSLAQAHASQRTTPADIADAAQGFINIIHTVITPKAVQKLARKINQQVHMELEQSSNYQVTMPRVDKLYPYVKRAHGRNSRLVSVDSFVWMKPWRR